jgi:hypothetical protein
MKFQLILSALIVVSTVQAAPHLHRCDASSATPIKYSSIIGDQCRISEGDDGLPSNCQCPTGSVAVSTRCSSDI